jgi:SpoVK/Ycf46/Vps4 family AAA+-type ATPase
LSQVVSKYIGETSKNLNSIFTNAENKNWILFFDEGDALFGKRSDSSKSDNQNAHYANQDTAFLLQKIESFQGFVIIASNYKDNIDKAFSRRFQSVIHFGMPDPAVALQFWHTNLPKELPFEEHIRLEDLIQKFQLSQAQIISAIQWSCVRTLQAGEKKINRTTLERTIRDQMIQ